MGYRHQCQGFLSCFSHRFWSSPASLGALTSGPRDPLVSALPVLGFTGMCHHTQPLRGCRGYKRRRSCWCSGLYSQRTLFPALSAVLSALDKLAVGPVPSPIYPQCPLTSARPLHKCHMSTEVFKDSISHFKESSFALSFKTNQRHISHIHVCLPLLSPQKYVSSTRPDNVKRFSYFYVILQTVQEILSKFMNL